MQVERLDERLVRWVAPNGLRVLAEGLPGVRSAAIGIWVRTASAHEAPAQMGVSHLLEHLVFKGTERRTAHQIARELECRGGSLDAYTSRDHTSFQAHVLDADLPVAVDVLTDLVRRPLLRDADLTLERNVVLEEISAVADAPEDLVFELHAKALWPEHPYGFSILGTPETVGALRADDLRGVHRRGYFPGNCVIAAAGSVEPERLLETLEREGWFEGPPAVPLAPVEPAPAQRGQRSAVARDTQQCHLVFGSDTFPASDPRRYALMVLVTVFGGGMSSRLFQRIREERGLAYAVFAFQHLNLSGGMVGVYLGTQPETAEPAIEGVLEEYRRLAAEGLPAEELTGGKRQVQGQIMLALESPVNRMHRLARVELTGERYRRLDEILEEIDRVTSDDVATLAAEFFAPERQTLIRLGPTTVRAP
jgi:predicted Zn-dependent peptidase